MISEKKRLQIANICYANVAGLFASFHNPNFRGLNFNWDKFVAMCVGQSHLWLFQNGIPKDDKVVALGQQFAKEIAENLIRQMTE